MAGRISSKRTAKVCVLFAPTVVLCCDLLLTLHLRFLFGVLVVSPDVIKEKGLEHVTVEDLVTVITPKGRGTDL